MEFSSFNLHPDVAAGGTAAGYTKPTPIQEQAIPAVMEGRDVMGLAQTGTGKTAAFVLPILNRLMQGGRRQVRTLILAPTRELAEQTHEAIGVLGRKTRLKSVTVYGGVGVNPQVEKLKRGPEFVVACPGRLLDHINRRTIDLSRVEVLVIDEADQMFDMGFFPDLKRILACLPKQRQNLLFSATMPKEILHLAKDVLHEPVTLQVGASAPAVTVKHALYPVAPHLKTPLLLELLQHTNTESVLVFARTKQRTKRLAEQIVKAGHRAASLQGNLSQARRDEAMGGFRTGKFQILVATDIAARGIDVSNISHVINYDIPNTTDAYIHRIGRTGRATRSGDAYTLVTGEDKVMVHAIERVLGRPIERRTLEGFNYNVAGPAKDTEFAFARQTRQPADHRFAGNRRPGAPARPNSSGGARQAPARTFMNSDRKTAGPSKTRRHFA